jgi:ketosteroid isomerase-like protein
MSQENVEVIRDIAAAINEGDFGRAIGHLTNDVVLEAPAGIRGGTFRGREAVGEWFGDWFRIFDWNVHTDIREIAEIGDDGVLLVAATRGRGRRCRGNLRLALSPSRGKNHADGRILVARGGPRSRRTVGVGDVAGERRADPPRL